MSIMTIGTKLSIIEMAHECGDPYGFDPKTISGIASYFGITEMDVEEVMVAASSWGIFEEEM